jgi:hypothetical protein
MTDIHDDLDDLDDLDRIWSQEEPLLRDDVAVDFGVDERPLFDDEPVMEDPPEVVEALGAYDELDDEDNVVALHGHDRFRWGRVSRRKTATLLHASTIAIGTGIGAIGVMLTLVILTGRLLTARQLFYMAHWILGILVVHAFAAGLGTLWTRRDSPVKDVVRKLSTSSMAAAAWLAAVTGTWLVYPGYRADPPPGADLALYPRQYLLRTPSLRFWETFAMEWNVHVGWITPFLATSVAFVAVRYGRRLVADLQVRKMLINLFVIAAATGAIAALLGALVNLAAPNDFLHRAWSP